MTLNEYIDPFKGKPEKEVGLEEPSGAPGTSSEKILDNINPRCYREVR